MTTQWFYFNFYSHHFLSRVSHNEASALQAKNAVSGRQVLVRHFGVVLDREEWLLFSKKRSSNKVEFVISPYTRFESRPGDSRSSCTSPFTRSLWVYNQLFWSDIFLSMAIFLCGWRRE